jgi:ribosomal protein S13
MLPKKKRNELDFILSKNLIDKKLKTELKEIDLFSKKIKTYKGIRNKLKYPARGQRTHTNAKTKKKL